MIQYRLIDLKTYARRAHLEYFMSMEHPQLNLTVMVDVTDLKEFCKKNHYSFFLTFLHVVALSADEIVQFRQRIHRLSSKETVSLDKKSLEEDIEIREYEESPTSHTESTEGDLYCYCPLYHHMPWKDYIETASKRQLEARESGTLEEDKEIEAFYFPTCLPWIHYMDVVHPMTNRYDSNPRFSWGKYEEDFKKRLMMPLTVACHHGLVDGKHVARFYENVEKNMKKLVEHGEI